MEIVRYDFKCQFKKFLDRSVKFIVMEKNIIL